MGSALRDKTVLIIGRGSGIARAITLLARSEGARVVVAGRDKAKLAHAYADIADTGIRTEVVDITDDESIAALAERLGPVDNVVSTASARARGNLADLQRENLRQSFDTKVIGPTMLAKYFAPQINPGGSFVLFSGVHAFKLNVGYLGVGITNGAVDFLTRWLAVELAPIRVNAISPRVIDTGAWDSLGAEGKRNYFEHIAAGNPARRIATPEDVASAVLFAMTNTS
jgi:NAD(P)-dependent dehydrogenase (short-subunit alcohol dehydrogenase family)